MGEHLLDMDVNLSQQRRGDRETVALVRQDGHALLNAEWFEDGLGDLQRQAVERPASRIANDLKRRRKDAEASTLLDLYHELGVLLTSPGGEGAASCSRPLRLRRGRLQFDLELLTKWPLDR